MGYAGLHSNLERNHTKMIVIIVICLLQLQKKSPAFLRTFEKKCFFCGLSRWFIQDFFGQTKSKKPSGSTRDIFFQSAAKSKQEILPKTLFAKSKQLSSMGSVSKLVNHSLFLFHIFHAHKKNLPRSLQYLPKKTCQGPKT